MASAQVFTPETVTDLNIVTNFNALMVASLGADSIYIRTKETLTELLTGEVGEQSSMTASERSAVLSEALAGMTTAITSQAMQTALQMAKEDRDAPYEYAKVVADVKLKQEQADKMEEENLLIQAQKDKMTIEGWKLQAEIYTKNGINVTTQNIAQPVLSSILQTNQKATDIVQGEIGKANAASAINSTIRKDGVFSWTTNTDGYLNSAIEVPVSGLVPLTKAQADVAVRQEKAFDDNKVQHAANSSANMIGLLLSTENYGVLQAADVTKWRTAVDELNTPTA